MNNSMTKLDKNNFSLIFIAIFFTSCSFQSETPEEIKEISGS
jgi:PBP1b-binding outer membrane lipoprotein LpoB